MKRKLMTLPSLLTLMLGAQVFQNSDWDKKARQVKDDPSAMSISGKTVIYSIAAPYIPVDPTKKYKLSAGTAFQPKSKTTPITINATTTLTYTTNPKTESPTTSISSTLTLHLKIKYLTITGKFSISGESIKI